MGKRPVKKSRSPDFHAKLAELGYPSYHAYLRGEHWADVRQRFMASKLPKCCGGCGAVHGLALHHRTYKRIGTERLMDVILVCKECHAKIHDRERKTGDGLWGSTKVALRNVRRTKEQDRSEPQGDTRDEH